MKFEETCFTCAPRKECCLKGQVFVVWIDLSAIETCILVEIDLQVYIFARKVGLTGLRYTFIFCCLLDETHKSPGDGEILMVTQTLRVSPRQRNSFAFFLSNARVTIFLTEL